MNEKECPRLFVYGTLMDPNQLNAVVSEDPVETAEGTIDAVMFNCGSFPMILEDGDRKVYGRVYTFKNLERILPSLDRYERCNLPNENESYYIRKIVDVTRNCGERFSAWTYVGNRSSMFCRRCCVPENLIESGRWSV